MLRSSSEPLSDIYDLHLLDLDGVVYTGAVAVPGAVSSLSTLRGSGTKIAFVTNNSSRPPHTVVHHLNLLGVETDTHQVVTSAQAASRLLLGLVSPGGRVLVAGGEGVEVALKERGLTPVSDIADEPEAVVTGYGPDLTWLQIMRAAVKIRSGWPWVATNSDLTVPTEFGLAPGHGVVVKMVQEFSGSTPLVAGKPERALIDEAVLRLGGARPLMVGDRLDTDIAGAHNAQIDSLLVLTGVTGLPELVAAAPPERPTYLASDLGGLHTSHPAVDRVDDCWQLGQWRSRVVTGRLVVEGEGPCDDWWRCAAMAAWAYLDRTGETACVDGLVLPRSVDQMA
jgi:glycerol-1-phosphatase